MTDRPGASHDRSGQQAVRVAGAGRAARGRAAHPALAARAGRATPCPSRMPAASAWLPGRGDIADVELERFEATEMAAGQAGDDVEPIALANDLGDVGPPERDPVEHVPLPAQGQLAVPAGGRPDPGHGQPQDRDERVGVARPARRQAGQLAIAGRSRRRRPAAPGRWRRRRADPAAPTRRRGRGIAR